MSSHWVCYSWIKIWWLICSGSCSHILHHIWFLWDQKLLTLDDGQRAPLDLLPAAVDEPLVDLFHQLRQVVRIRLHNLVKLCKLDRWTRFTFKALVMCNVCNPVSSLKLKASAFVCHVWQKNEASFGFRQSAWSSVGLGTIKTLDQCFGGIFRSCCWVDFSAVRHQTSVLRSCNFANKLPAAACRLQHCQGNREHVDAELQSEAAPAGWGTWWCWLLQNATHFMHSPSVMRGAELQQCHDDTHDFVSALNLSHQTSQVPWWSE